MHPEESSILIMTLPKQSSIWSSYEIWFCNMLHLTFVSLILIVLIRIWPLEGHLVGWLVLPRALKNFPFCSQLGSSALALRSSA